MRIAIGLFLVLLLAASASAGPSTLPAKTQDRVKTLLADLPNLEIDLSYFTPGQRDFDRSLNISVTADDDPPDAEGLMNKSQAAATVQVIATDGFLERAEDLAGAHWGEQNQPFYIIAVKWSAGGIYLKCPANAEAVRWLADFRDALGNGPAGRTIDRLAGRIDPAARRWKDVAVVPPSTQPALLLPQDSPMHPGHTFMPIDPAWHVESAYYKPDRNGLHWIKPEFADPKTCYVTIDYRDGTANTPIKTICLYPSGRVFTERDCLAVYVDMLPPRGDEYYRCFDEAGVIQSYFHWKDGRCVESAKVRDDGGIDRYIAPTTKPSKPSAGP